jgi:hypothetical protein
MADHSRLMEALRNADAAGDTEAATRIAQMIRDGGPRRQRLSGRLINPPAIPPQAPIDVLRLIGKFAQGATPAVIGAAGGHALAGPPGALVGSMAVPVADALGGLWNTAMQAGGMPRAQIQPTSEFIRDLMKRTPLYDPARSPAERVAEAAGEATGMVGAQLSAAARMAVKGATPFLRDIGQTLARAPKTQIATAPVAAGTGQYVSEKTKNPLAGLAASLLSGVVVGRVGAPRIKAIDSTALKAQANAFYKKADDAGVVIKADYMEKFRNEVLATIENEGYDKDLHKGLLVVLRRLSEEAENMTLGKLERTRRVLRGATKNHENDESRIAAAAIDTFDNAVEQIKAGNLVSGDVSGIKALVQARAYWSRKVKVEVIEDLMEKAGITSGQFSQSGMENAIRNAFKPLATNKKRMATFTKPEQKMIRQIARGTIGQNILRGVGKFAPRGVISAAPTAGLVFAGEPMSAAVLAATGFSAQKAALMVNQRRVKELQTLMATGQRPPGRYSNVPPALVRSVISNPDAADTTPRGVSLFDFLGP